ncbi:DNA repair protein RecN [Hahella sp. SMD15-11]|uniref:DNA repair protein RecN n=1 Tax=Thermohahella caldifontis TaxID=3142973 RepID=A0AB39UVE7_9GAMM
MLTQLRIQNLAIADNLDIRFGPGMTVISGETGAGKSILLDALALVTGERASADLVRAGAERADMSAEFDVHALPDVQRWLAERELEMDGSCVLRRTITSDGRSRGYINGQPMPLGELKALGELLVNIHGQHAHQALLRKEQHLRILDDLVGQPERVQAVRKAWRQRMQARQALDQARANQDEQAARVQLLEYQVRELDELDLQEGELEQLEARHYELSNAQSLLGTLYAVESEALEGDGGILEQLQRATHQLDDLELERPALNNARALMHEALIQLQEAASELRHLQQGIELDPEALKDVENRLSTVYDLARKHHVQPEALCAHHRALKQELEALSGGEQSIEALEAALEKADAAYREQALALSAARKAAAAELEAEVAHRLGLMDMHCEFRVALTTLEEPSATGLESVEFLVSTNAGQPLKPLQKVASGGELSRISLAIQVVSAASSATPTLVFDEVDVGIGGATAEIVGRLLRELATHCQILVVTHQPQVASQGHQHLFVSKHDSGEGVRSRVETLDADRRVLEVARMLGGVHLTESTLAHAREMVSGGQLH